ncbi:DNA-binding response regulator [Pleurocapsa sp. CCALA 161]|uniref:response regulator transcription factor n=1 Tax=Pleurocapsa sp. CCALA 161 TaxID=2107688 RepID=UPI000D0634C8|nr:response regulator transcription factor [Pleurocapsa sp. CCALA 161]PSB11121.1 DNA-binding response regulator [Pleurocapsa sp. CCALA 161]
MKKILIVDDDLTLRKILQNSLEQRGYQVISVGSGTDALASFSQDVPDLVVSDVSMPEMDGFEFCRQLRSQPSGKLIPFIFLSAKGELDDRVQGHTIGADNYLTKPFEMKELLANIEALIERSRRVHAEIVHLIEQLAYSQVKDTLLNGCAGEIQTSVTPKNIKDEDTAVAASLPEPLPLTPAEERVFWETIQGYTNKQISDRLFISPRTVQTHLSNILNKLDLNNRTQLVRFAYEQGYEKA